MSVFLSWLLHDTHRIRFASLLATNLNKKRKKKKKNNKTHLAGIYWSSVYSLRNCMSLLICMGLQSCNPVGSSFARMLNFVMVVVIICWVCRLLFLVCLHQELIRLLLFFLFFFFKLVTGYSPASRYAAILNMENADVPPANTSTLSMVTTSTDNYVTHLIVFFTNLIF